MVAVEMIMETPAPQMQLAMFIWRGGQIQTQAQALPLWEAINQVLEEEVSMLF